MVTNLSRFLEAVRAGKVEGITGHFDQPGMNFNWINIGDNSIELGAHNEISSQIDTDHMCAEIRRWLTGKGFEWCLTDESIWAGVHDENTHGYDPECNFPWPCTEHATELESHLAAFVFCLEAEE